MSRVLAVALLGLCACGGGPSSGVELTLRFDDTVSDAALAAVTTLSFASSGDEQGTYSFTLGRAVNREERLVYRSLPASMKIGIEVTATDGATHVVAQGGQPSIALDPHHATAVEITLSASIAPDLGVDLGQTNGVDFGVDAAVPSDLALELGTDAASGCHHALCESFEGVLGSAWTQHQQNGTSVIDTTRAHGGTHALHLSTNTVPSGTTVDLRLSESETLQTPKTLPPDVYVRAWYYLSSGPVNRLELTSMVESQSPYQGEQVAVNVATQIETGDTVGSSFTSGSNAFLPLGAWACIEWHVHVATDSTGVMDVWLNDAAVTGIEHAQATNPSGGLAVLAVGPEFYAPTVENPATQIWVDDVAIDTVRIGCTN